MRRCTSNIVGMVPCAEQRSSSESGLICVTSHPACPPSAPRLQQRTVRAQSAREAVVHYRGVYVDVAVPSSARRDPHFQQHTTHSPSNHKLGWTQPHEWRKKATPTVPPKGNVEPSRTSMTTRLISSRPCRLKTTSPQMDRHILNAEQSRARLES